MRGDQRTRTGFRFQTPLSLSDLYLILSKIRYHEYHPFRKYPNFVPSFENKIVQGFLSQIPDLTLHPAQANRAYDELVKKRFWNELPRIGFEGRKVRVFTITELGWIHAINLMEGALFSKGLNRIFRSPSHAA